MIYLKQHTTHIAIKGWKCKNNHTFRAMYSNISKNRGCAVCSKKIPKILIDYQKLAISRGLIYILDTIPQNVHIAVEGWKCKKGHITKVKYHDMDTKAGCTLCNEPNSEIMCREIMEEIMEVKFAKKKNFLQKMELDGYNETLKLAFEYNGKQHYEHVLYFQKTVEQFNQQVARDKLKKELCIEKGITLIVVPYKYSYLDRQAMKKFIKQELVKTKYISIEK